jgi:P2-related tail formation protein
MVGDGDDRHAEALATVIDGLGVVIRLAAKVADECCVAHPGSFGVDVKVASHGKSMALRYEQSVKRLRNVSKCVYVTY